MGSPATVGSTQSSGSALDSPTPSDLQALRERIEDQLRYPYSFRRRGIQGRATLAVSLDENGRAQDIRISQTSGSAELDALALEAARAAAPFPALSPARAVSFVLPIEFRTSDPTR
jgi:TonB family protein